MEQFHVISILGANARMIDPSTSLDEARRKLNRQIQDGLGEALTWTAGFLCLYLAWYACKGHLMIQNDRRAKLYWLQNDAGNEAFSSDDPLIVTMPVQDARGAAPEQRHHA